MTFHQMKRPLWNLALCVFSMSVLQACGSDPRDAVAASPPQKSLSVLSQDSAVDTLTADDREHFLSFDDATLGQFRTQAHLSSAPLLSCLPGYNGQWCLMPEMPVLNQSLAGTELGPVACAPTSLAMTFGALNAIHSAKSGVDVVLQSQSAQGRIMTLAAADEMATTPGVGSFNSAVLTAVSNVASGFDGLIAVEHMASSADQHPLVALVNLLKAGDSGLLSVFWMKQTMIPLASGETTTAFVSDGTGHVLAPRGYIENSSGPLALIFNDPGNGSAQSARMGAVPQAKGSTSVYPFVFSNLNGDGSLTFAMIREFLAIHPNGAAAASSPQPTPSPSPSATASTTQSSVVAAITADYQSSLSRSPASVEVQYWVQKSAAGEDLGSIAGEIASSTEARIVSVYQDVLNRVAETAAIDSWTQQLNSGLSLASFRQSVALSGEAATDVSRLYSKYLHRPGSTSEWAYWQNFMAAGHSLAWVENQISSSSEALAQKK